MICSVELRIDIYSLGACFHMIVTVMCYGCFLILSDCTLERQQSKKALNNQGTRIKKR